MMPPKSILRQIERMCSNFLWSNDDGNPRRIWRSWNRVTYLISENGLGLRSLEDVAIAFSCKIWWKWRIEKGLWSRYLHEVTWKHSIVRQRLYAVDSFMRDHTLVLVRDGTSSFFFDNWSGKGAIVDKLHEEIDDSLRSMTIRDLYVHGTWDLVALKDLLPLEVFEFVRAFDFEFSDAPDVIIW